MKKIIFSIFATLISAVTFAQCNDLFFSEYVEGSSSNKALEIYNPTSNPIDLTDYVIYRANNGVTIPSDSLHMEGILAAGAVFVAGNPTADPIILNISDTLHTITFYNGDDAMWLKKKSTGVILDIIGEIGVDPGVNWAVGTGATSEFTLIRKQAIQGGETNWTIASGEYDVYPQNTMDSLGTHTMIACGTPCTNTSATISATVCDTYTAPDGATYTSTGSYTATITNTAGCDSVITINLTVNNSTTFNVTDNACESYTYNGITYTSSGTYTQTLTNSVGCDSTIILTLDITPTPNAPMVMGDTSYCEGETATALTIAAPSSDSLIISGVADGTLTGGLPKVVEFYVLEDIADLSTYGFGSANNGQGTDGEEFTFPAVSVTAGTYLHVATDSANFFTFFGFYPDYVDASAGNVNGDDAIELFHNGAVIDVFGDINVDGTGQPWEYLDGWAYRKDNSAANGGVFNINEWDFSGVDGLEGGSNNASASVPFPAETYAFAPYPVVYTWYSDASLSNVITTGSTYTPTATTGTTSYYVTTTNSGTNSCEGPSTEVTITFSANPTVVANASTQLVCEGDDVTLTGSGADTYQWNNGVTDGVAFAATSTMTYVVVGTTAQGCSDTDSVEITVNALPNVTFGALDTVCVDDAAFTLTQGSPSGGVYSGVGVSLVSDDFSPSAAGVGSHVLTYEYTDGNNCTASATSTIVVESCAGMETIDMASVVLYPNPASDMISVSGLENIIEIQVTDLSGNIIAIEKSNSISVEALSAGMYLLNIVSENGTVAKAFVKK